MKKICINFLIFFINFISSYVGQTEEIGKEAVTYFLLDYSDKFTRKQKNTDYDIQE
jgi:hypothetical protein